ncbi:MAG: hypothetical protein K2X66_07540 [Cyanobacteria bacterium]|nr:hypothetical protein [Cyanobacteriota bacterium]
MLGPARTLFGVIGFTLLLFILVLMGGSTPFKGIFVMDLTHDLFHPVVHQTIDAKNHSLQLESKLHPSTIPPINIISFFSPLKAH